MITFTWTTTHNQFTVAIIDTCGPLVQVAIVGAARPTDLIGTTQFVLVTHLSKDPPRRGFDYTRAGVMQAKTGRHPQR